AARSWITASARGRLQGFHHGRRIMTDHPKIGAGGGVGVFAPLFPVPQGSERNMKAGREFFLRQAEGAANDPRLRRPFHALEILLAVSLQVSCSWCARCSKGSAARAEIMR